MQKVLSLLKDLTPLLPVPISPIQHAQSSLSTTDIPSFALEYGTTKYPRVYGIF